LAVSHSTVNIVHLAAPFVVYMFDSLMNLDVFGPRNYLNIFYIRVLLLLPITC